MFSQKLLAPAIQTAGRSLFCSTSEVFQNVRNFNQRDYNASFNDGNSPQTLFGRFSSQFRRTEHGSFIKVVSRNFGASTFHSIREFSSNYNEITHNILCSLPEYSSTTVNAKDNQNINTFDNDTLTIINHNKESTLDELVQQFKRFSYMIGKSNVFIDQESISFVLTSITSKQEELSFPQLLDILSCIKLWQSAMPTNEDFEIFFNKIENYCSRKVKKWNTSQCLLVADYWYILNGNKVSRYLREMQESQGRFLMNFSQSQFVQYMFYVNVFNGAESIKSKRTALQRKLIEILPILSIKEIGIISMGLFKASSNSYSILTAPLIGQIIQKLIIHKNDTPDELIVPILKCLKNSNMSTNFCLSLFDGFCQQIDKHNSYVQMHFCDLASSRMIYHPEFMNKLLKSFVENLPSLRMKDIERYVFTAMLFNIGTETNQIIFHSVIEELRKPERIIEFNHFPHVFVSCITYLTAAGIYPLDLISAVFQPSMLQYLKDVENSCSYSDIFRSVLQLSWSLSIEGPSNYLGYQLDPDVRNKITKLYLQRLPQDDTVELNNNEKKTLALKESLKIFLDTATPSIVNILPQFSSPDVVFCTNNLGEPVPIPDNYFKQQDVHVKVPVLTEAGIMWNAVVYAKTSCLIKPTKVPKGNFVHKIRLLERLGYVVSLAKPVPENLGVVKKNLYFEEILCNSTLSMKRKTFVPDDQLQHDVSTLQTA